MYGFKVLFVLFIIYSFLGWIIETIYCSINDKKFANRGFLVGPICPIYGTAAILMIIFLQKYINEPLTLFVLAVVLCSVVEYIVSFIMEKLFNTRWWDYSKRLFNINGRICLSNAVCFGALGLLLLYFINPILLSLIFKMPLFLLNIIFISLLIIFLIDFIFSFSIISKFTKDAKLIKKDSSKDINEKIKEFLESKSILYNRLTKAFPNFIIKKK